MTTHDFLKNNPIVTEYLHIPSDTPGIELYVRNKRPASMNTFSNEKTIVMVHGATYSIGSLYDVGWTASLFWTTLPAMAMTYTPWTFAATAARQDRLRWSSLPTLIRRLSARRQVSGILVQPWTTF